MSFERARAIADAVLYEGYALYPYRGSSLKNRRRWMFGTLYPRAFAEQRPGVEPCRCACEGLLEVRPGAELQVRVRFLHALTRTETGGPGARTWEEATTREVDLGPLAVADLAARPLRQRFAFGAERAVDAGGSREQEAIEGELELSLTTLRDGIYRVAVSVLATTPLPEQEGEEAARLRALGALHVLLWAREADFVSLLDPPEPLRALAEACRNTSLWPVLAGAPGERDLLLCSPIILADHPAVAPESPGDLFDGTEMDEMLSLRILTLTDEEKREGAAGDARIRALLDRTEELGPEQLGRLHGAIRSLGPAAPSRSGISRIRAGGALLGPGDPVLLRPRGRSDVFDLALRGLPATIVSIEQSVEDQTYVTVTVDDDPGRDLGAQGFPGHRFFFRLDEIEPRPRGGGERG